VQLINISGFSIAEGERKVTETADKRQRKDPKGQMEMKEIVIIPTGDEIKKGTVLDTNSPRIMELVLAFWPACKIVRAAPPADVKEEIQNEIRHWGKGRGIIFLTGGSGGGRAFDCGLAVDCTHTALAELLPNSEAVEIVGSNGHLMAKIVAGVFEDKLVVSLPGPTVEAVSGAKAVLESLAENNIDCKKIAGKAAQAVFAQYGSWGHGL